MTEELISYKTAILAEEKGCNLKSNNAYANFNNSGRVILRNKSQMIISRWDIENKVKVYSQSLLQKWLREEHNIHAYAIAVTNFEDPTSFMIGLPKAKGSYIGVIHSMLIPHSANYAADNMEENHTFEEALEITLYEALKLIK